MHFKHANPTRSIIIPKMAENAKITAEFTKGKERLQSALQDLQTASVRAHQLD